MTYSKWLVPAVRPPFSCQSWWQVGDCPSTTVVEFVSSWRCYWSAHLRPLQTKADAISPAVPPDTPPPSSPSASEMSFSSGARSSVETDRQAFHYRLSAFGRKTASHHRRQSSQLSRSSILAEPIPEETARYAVSTEGEEVNYTMKIKVSAIKEEDSPLSSPEPPRPLVIRKKPSIASNRLSVGLDAFQLRMTGPKSACATARQTNVVTKTADDDQCDWEEVESGRQMLWATFCQEAVSELQKRYVTCH